VLSRIAGLSSRQPDRTLAGIAVLAIGCGILVGAGEDRLSLGGSGTTVTPLKIRVSGPLPVRSGPYRVALTVMRSSLRATPGVIAVSRGPVSDNGRATTLVVTLSDDPGQSEEAVEEIESKLDPGVLRISFAGGADELREARSQSIDDLRLLLLAVPLVALLAVATLGARGALATLFAAAAAVLGAGALCVGISLLVDLSVLALVGAAAAGIPCSVLLCALARRGAEPLTLFAAALASAVAFGSLAALGVGYLAALGVGGVIASLLAAPVAVAAISAATSLWDLAAADLSPLPRAFDRLVAPLGRSRLVAAAIAVLSIATLAVLALPATRLDAAALGATAPPSIGLERGLIAAAAGLVALTAIGTASSRRPLASLAIALSAASAAAAAGGLTVVVFQDGHLQEALDFHPSAISVGALAAALVTVAAASAAEGVATLTTIDDRRGDGAAAPPPSLDGYGKLAAAGAISSAITVLFAASLLASSLDFVKTMGFAVAAGLMLDLLLVRGLLAPALLTALQRRRTSDG
jgi:hypothetical protein